MSIADVFIENTSKGYFSRYGAHIIATIFLIIVFTIGIGYFKAIEKIRYYRNTMVVVKDEKGEIKLTDDNVPVKEPLWNQKRCSPYWMLFAGFVDENNIGIFGWSYGGYMSSLCITKGADVFKSAIAVAPVTNWRYYDNIYTERFMQKPQDNGENYDINSPINHVEKLKGNYLLIHGTADDNVHFQNATEMV